MQPVHIFTSDFHSQIWPSFFLLFYVGCSVRTARPLRFSTKDRVEGYGRIPRVSIRRVLRSNVDFQSDTPDLFKFQTATNSSLFWIPSFFWHSLLRRMYRSSVLQPSRTKNFPHIFLLTCACFFKFLIYAIHMKFSSFFHVSLGATSPYAILKF